MVQHRCSCKRTPQVFAIQPRPTQEISAHGNRKNVQPSTVPQWKPSASTKTQSTVRCQTRPRRDILFQARAFKINEAIQKYNTDHILISSEATTNPRPAAGMIQQHHSNLQVRKSFLHTLRQKKRRNKKECVVRRQKQRASHHFQKWSSACRRKIDQ